MFVLCAHKTQLILKEREPITSGSVNAYQVGFEFSADWDGLTKTAVFRAGDQVVSILLDDSGECGIPWEVLQTPALRLDVGVYGEHSGETVLPTVWTSLGIILKGVDVPAEGQTPPTPEIWEQELAKKGDRIDYTVDGKLGLYAGETLLSSVLIQGGGEGDTSDHRLLSGREAENQHPIEAISGLKEKLERVPSPAEPLTNEELEEMLK